MELKWIRLNIDMFDNRKIKYIRTMPEGNNIVLIWVMLLTMAGRCNDSGKIYLTESIPYTIPMLAGELGFEQSTVELALTILKRLNMVCEEDGCFTIEGWEEHQSIEKMEELRDQNRQRQQRWRDRRKAEKEQAALPPPPENEDVNDSNVTNNVMSRGNNAIEEEEEREREKESSSSSSYAREEEKAKVEALGGELGGGLVRLSQDQMEDLLDRLSFDEFNHYIDAVRRCEEKGKHFAKSHYQAILDMAKKDRKLR